MNREVLDQAARYSRFVLLMRRTLPAAAAALLLLIFIWPSPNGDMRSLPASTAGQREMTNLRYSGLNTNGEPMSVTATKAIQAGDMQQAINLENVVGRLERKGGGWVNIEAKTGIYDQKGNLVTLTGDVHLTDDKGYDITTQVAEINLNTPAQAHGDNPVTGRGPQGNIRGNGFKITDEGRTVIITGRSRLDLQRGAQKR